MKRTFLLLFLPILVFLLAGCSDDSTGPGDDGNGNNGGNPGLSMQINGTDWVANTVAADTIIQNGVIASIGLSGVTTTAFDAVGIAVASLTGVQESTYNYPAPAGTAISFFYGNPTNSNLDATLDPSQSTGNITFSSINLTNGTISGTFSMNLYRLTDGGLVEIRNGAFNNIPIVQLGNVPIPLAEQE